MRKLLVLFCLAAFAGGFCLAKDDYSDILKRNIFADDQPPPPKPVTSILKPVVTEPLALDKTITIKCIFYSAKGGSRVIIDVVGKNNEDFYSEGDDVATARILTINSNSVVFLYNGNKIELALDNKPVETNTAAPVITQPSGSPVVNISNFKQPVIPRVMPPVDINLDQTVDKIRSDEKLMASMNVSPSVGSDGKVQGFLVTSLPSDSLPVKMGIANGDILKSINGTEINSLAAGFQVYNNIVNSGIKLVTVEVLRNNQPMMFTYHLK